MMNVMHDRAVPLRDPQVDSCGWVVVNTKMPKDLVDIIVNNLDDVLRAPQPVTTFNPEGEGENKEVRAGQVQWMWPTAWVAGIVSHSIMMMNEVKWQYDLSPMQEDIQYLPYEVGDFYDWHIDSHVLSTYPGRHSERKLSFSLQLSDASEYEGGTLELAHPGSGNITEAPKERGDLIIFPSSTPHRVTKITKGTRRALVGWQCGPRFR